MAIMLGAFHYIKSKYAEIRRLGTATKKQRLLSSLVSLLKVMNATQSVACVLEKGTGQMYPLMLQRDCS